MTAGRVANDGCPGLVEARIILHFLENAASCEADVQKSSRPTTTRVANPSVFYVASDYAFRSEGVAEMSDVRQVIGRLPETTMHNKEKRERSAAVGKPKLNELTGVTAITGPSVKRRRVPI